MYSQTENSISTKLFIAAVFLKHEIGNHPDDKKGRLSKVWYTHTMTSSTAIKKNEKSLHLGMQNTLLTFKNRCRQ